ncbi:MAG: DUF4760 domain-containing protein [Vulcanimicrobiaceae bacterium]
MSAEWLSVAASLVTLVLILGSVIAALLQMRHMRNANQIDALTEIRETMESPDFRAAIKFVMRELPPLIEDPANRRKILQRPLPTQFEQVRWVATFFESFGVMVKYGALDKSIACDMWGSIVLGCWGRLAPFITNLRYTAKNPALYENFEYLALISSQFRERYPNGAYPRNLPRMPAVEIWPEAL